MKNKVRHGDYDNFMKVKLGSDENFINSLKRCTISYHLKEDFERVWDSIYDELLSNEGRNLEHNQNVALKRITQHFFMEDAVEWINTKIRRKDYRLLYLDILPAYIRGIKDVKKFSLEEFGSSNR